MNTPPMSRYSFPAIRYTPFPLGDMPKDVVRHTAGPPFGRIVLELDHLPSDGETVLDRRTGHRFKITTDVPCGAGCRCAAEAEWVQP